MNNLMILGAGVLQVPLIQQTKNRGFKTIVVSNQKKLPGFNYASFPVYHDYLDKEGILEIARKYKIDGIITDQTDVPIRTVAYVAEKLGLPGIGYDIACLFTDKFLMREQCKKLGINTLSYKKVNKIQEAKDFLNYLKNDLKSDAIIKPIDNQGSQGAYKIQNEKKLQEVFDEAVSYSPSKSVLIEQFVNGEEFVVEGLAFNYKFKNLICGDTLYFDIPDVFSATTRVFPSKAPKKNVKKVEDINEKIVTGFGLKQGITHSEYIMNGDDVILIETAARGGGVYISSDLISISTGLNTEDFLIDMAIGKLEKFPLFDIKGISCCYVAFFLPVGTVISLDGLEEVTALTYTHRHNLDTLKVGDITIPFKDKISRKFIIVSAENNNQLSERVDFIKKILKLVVKTNKGLKGPIWH